MPAEPKKPDWAPAGAGPEFATRVVAGVPEPAAARLRTVQPRAADVPPWLKR